MSELEVTEGEKYHIPAWDTSVEVLEVRESHDEVRIQGADIDTWESLTWFRIQVSRA